MIVYKTETVEQSRFVSFKCDRCGKIVSDDMELQEVYSIGFTGGYSSVFGDMNEVTCDLCQQCLHELIKDFCVYNTED